MNIDMNIRDVPEEVKKKLHILKAERGDPKLAKTLEYLVEKNRGEWAWH